MYPEQEVLTHPRYEKPVTARNHPMALDTVGRIGAMHLISFIV